ncbi:hypothetical protein TNCT_657871 [Trichonephila clavata]|uniref:Uncharacterized protein n=1 Tax=Trichonephila clavata TaxID=2740835 RepID=A0A8X6LP02_TRICU|nr:hypothetical protein TNCT_657871 [Trichonephila clavata]
MWFPCSFAANGGFLKFATSPPIEGDRLSFPLDLATGWKFGMASVIGTLYGVLVIFLELDWVIFVEWVRRDWRYFVFVWKAFMIQPEPRRSHQDCLRVLFFVSHVLLDVAALLAFRKIQIPAEVLECDDFSLIVQRLVLSFWLK